MVRRIGRPGGLSGKSPFEITNTKKCPGQPLTARLIADRNRQITREARLTVSRARAIDLGQV